MSKNITDYLHFYLGCNIQFKGQEKKGKINIENLWQLVSVHQMTYKKIATIEAMGCVKSLAPEDIKPILRPLSSLEGKEKEWYGNRREFDGLEFLYLLKQGFDIFGLIEQGLAIDKTTLNKQS